LRERERERENLEEEIKIVSIVFIHTMNYAQSVLYTDPDSSDLAPTWLSNIQTNYN